MPGSAITYSHVGHMSDSNTMRPSQKADTMVHVIKNGRDGFTGAA